MSVAKKIAIFGCGPAGLLAAHAASINGCDFEIFSKKRKSHLFGSQYLHEPIPNVTGECEIVEYTLFGSPESYRQKVYGADWDGSVSAEDLEHQHYAWDIRSSYDTLWDMYSEYIRDSEVRSVAQIDDEINLDRFDDVISTIPRTVWGQRGDQFLSSDVYAIGDAPELDQEVPFSPQQDFLIVCDGTDDVSWYRLSKVFGYTTIEWPGAVKPPVSGVARVRKPLRYIPSGKNAADSFHHIGRYGKWQKGVLTTDAFRDAMSITAPSGVVRQQEVVR